MEYMYLNYKNPINNDLFIVFSKNIFGTYSIFWYKTKPTPMHSSSSASSVFPWNYIKEMVLDKQWNYSSSRLCT